MRVDGVELKANVVGADVTSALAALKVDHETTMRIWFYEELTPGAPPFPLLEAGLILRGRIKKNGEGDVTVKLRPCGDSQLTQPWLDNLTDLKVEVDRSIGGGEALAASYEVEFESDELPGVDGPPFAVTQLLSVGQQQLIAECAHIQPDLGNLTGLGPVAATRWKDVGGPDFADLDARAERWRVGDLEFLEISARAQTDDPDAKADRLRELVTQHRIKLDTDQRSKTERVLSALV
jgi:hypothetical protein